MPLPICEKTNLSFIDSSDDLTQINLVCEIMCRIYQDQAETSVSCPCL